MIKTGYLLLLMSLWLSGCAGLPSQAERNTYAQKLADHRGWVKHGIRTDGFIMQSYIPAKQSKTEVLTIYIEGDGMAWINATTPSFNPTPNEPVALKMALQDKNPAAYLARPCQYIDAADALNCEQKYWTSHRFSTEVIDASNQAIDQLKLKFRAEKLVLIGYSGGGAVAALVAAKRQDVARLVTVAGTLDHVTWTKLHKISPLTGSLNAADAWQALQKVPQLHLVGGGDRNMSPTVANAYAARFPQLNKPVIKVIDEFDHVCCWVEQWSALNAQITMQ